MKLAVIKFGGTSVESKEHRGRVCEHIETMLGEGYKVVVVVSAMGRIGAPYATDTLLGLIGQESPQAQARELDLAFACGEMLASAVIAGQMQQRGHRATCLTGQQAGIITDNNYGNARLTGINTTRILRLLQEECIVVVSGGQGATADGDITSLGRGSSDVTCCALGVALDAERIDVFTDVPGVMTADPRLIPEARVIERMSYITCTTLARLGARVMHPYAVEIAEQKPHISLRVRSTFADHPGTLIDNHGSDMLSLVALPPCVEAGNVAKISIVGRTIPAFIATNLETLLQREDICVLVSEERDHALTLLIKPHLLARAAKVLHAQILQYTAVSTGRHPFPPK